MEQKRGSEDSQFVLFFNDNGCVNNLNAIDEIKHSIVTILGISSRVYIMSREIKQRFP